MAFNDRSFTSKIGQLEGNLKSYIDEKIAPLVNYFDKRIEKEKETFSINYFVSNENPDPEYQLEDEESACLLMDGIIEECLNWENEKSSFKVKLKKFQTFIHCR
jgi:hypothetical protein